MTSRRRRERSFMAVRAEINVTSLVDVAFTLLVIFIITAPVLQGGVDVDLPEGAVGVVPASDQMLIVTIDEDGIVYLNEEPVPRENLQSSLGQLIRAMSVEMVYVRGDTAARYGPVFEVISGAAMQEGVGVSLVGREIRR